MAWFDYLKEQGFFSPDRNQNPIPKDNGFSIPYWEALDYLKKLSKLISTGKELQYIDEIIAIIIEVSEHPKDNYHTWSSFLQIIVNLPNDRIPISLFSYLPVWFSSRFDTMLQTSELCEKVLPKFLNDQSSAEDLAKSTAILKFLFTVSERPNADKLNNPGKSFYTPVYLYYLVNNVITRGLNERIVNQLPEDILWFIADNFNRIIRDNAVVAEINYTTARYLFTLIPKEENLVLKVTRESNNSPDVLLDTQIEKYLEKKSEDIITEVEANAIMLGLNLPEKTNDFYTRLHVGLENDFQSLLGYNQIKALPDDQYHDYEMLHVFAFMLRELLIRYSSTKPIEAVSLLSYVTKQQKYNLPFFKRLVIYVIARNWKQLKVVFWEMIGKNDENRYFSNYPYRVDLYDLLLMVQSELETEEINHIQTIIDNGPQGDRLDNNDPENWRHRWLDALKENIHFKEEYQQLSATRGPKMPKYAEEGKINIRVGTLSPYTTDDLIAKPADETFAEIKTFRNVDRFDDPSIDGFAETLGQAAEKSPAHFVDALPDQADLPLIYFYYLLFGLSKAWKDGSKFNWEKLLNFCVDYIETIDAPEKHLDDGLGANKDWIIGNIAYLISEGSRNKENSLPATLLPLVKSILISLAANLEIKINVIEITRDYPMYSMNSTQGKVLRAVLDFSLLEAQINESGNDERWDSAAKNIFEKSLRDGIIDGYVLLGMYLEQFLWLDNKWMKEQLNSFSFLSETYWLPFIGGLAYTRPAGMPDIYHLLVPVYKRAINENKGLENSYHHGLIRHIAAYYLWDFEKDFENSIVYYLISNGEPEHLRSLVNFFWQQEKYIKSYSQAEQQNVKNKVFKLWDAILTSVGEADSEEKKALYKDLTHFTEYVDVLSDEITRLIIKSVPYISDYYLKGKLFDELLRMQGNNSSSQIADILNHIDFSGYITNDQEVAILNIVEYLYQNGQQSAANTICNKISIKGYDFLKQIYRVNHS
jgi:hypothetical protein